MAISVGMVKQRLLSLLEVMTSVNKDILSLFGRNKLKMKQARNPEIYCFESLLLNDKLRLQLKFRP